MVGRLVQQQQVAGHHQRACQVQAHAPAAGERGDRTRVRLGREAQAMQQLAGARFGVIGAYLGHALVGGGNGFPVFTCRGRSLFTHDGGHLGVAFQHELQRRVGQRRGFLGHAGDADLAGQIDVALVRLQLTLHGGEQAGLAGPVAADHAHAVPRVKGQVDIGQQQPLATAQGEVTKGNHLGGPYNGMECAGEHLSCDVILALTNT